LKNPLALKVLVWSRGLLVTLQILTSSSPSLSLVEETHSSLGQRVSFSSIDVGSGFTAYVVSFLFYKSRLQRDPGIGIPLTINEQVLNLEYTKS